MIIQTTTDDSRICAQCYTVHYTWQACNDEQLAFARKRIRELLDAKKERSNNV